MYRNGRIFGSRIFCEFWDMRRNYRGDMNYFKFNVFGRYSIVLVVVLVLGFCFCFYFLVDDDGDIEVFVFFCLFRLG